MRNVTPNVAPKINLIIEGNEIRMISCFVYGEHSMFTVYDMVKKVWIFNHWFRGYEKSRKVFHKSPYDMNSHFLQEISNTTGVLIAQDKQIADVSLHDLPQLGKDPTLYKVRVFDPSKRKQRNLIDEMVRKTLR